MHHAAEQGIMNLEQGPDVAGDHQRDFQHRAHDQGAAQDTGIDQGSDGFFHGEMLA